MLCFGFVLMPDLTSPCTLRRSSDDYGCAPRSLCPWICLLLLFGVSCVGRANATDLQNGPVAAVGPGSQYTIADFDGDLRPDSASIESATNSLGRTSYRIELRLSEVGRQSIQVVAPTGGLQIEARDVNGDHTVDLVLSTAWFRQPVAIFLNDGHGNFSRAEPSAFPGAFSRSNRSWGSTSSPETGAVGIPPQSRDGVCRQTSRLACVRTIASLIRAADLHFICNPFLAPHSGRAPPPPNASL